MRTTIDIDGKLLDSVVDATGEKTKSRAVNAALKEYVRRKQVQELIDSWGKIVVDDYSDDALKLVPVPFDSGPPPKRTLTLALSHDGRGDKSASVCSSHSD